MVLWFVGCICFAFAAPEPLEDSDLDFVGLLGLFPVGSACTVGSGSFGLLELLAIHLCFAAIHAVGGTILLVIIIVWWSLRCGE